MTFIISTDMCRRPTKRVRLMSLHVDDDDDNDDVRLSGGHAMYASKQGFCD